MALLTDTNPLLLFVSFFVSYLTNNKRMNP